MSCLCGAGADGGAFSVQRETIPLRIIYNEYSIDDRLTVRSILKNNSETDKKLLVKISICNDKMEVIEEQECEMIIESKGTFEVE